jgi:hypothetical protein
MPEGSSGSGQQQAGAEARRVREAGGLSREQVAVRPGMVCAPGGREVPAGRVTCPAGAVLQAFRRSG